MPVSLQHFPRRIANYRIPTAWFRKVADNRTSCGPRLQINSITRLPGRLHAWFSQPMLASVYTTIFHSHCTIVFVLDCHGPWDEARLASTTKTGISIILLEVRYQQGSEYPLWYTHSPQRFHRFSRAQPRRRGGQSSSRKRPAWEHSLSSSRLQTV